MISSLFRHLLIPGFEGVVKRRRTFTYWRELETSQWCSRPDLETLQLAALRRLLQHAATTCPYYAAQWTALGLAVSELGSIGDFARWPLTDRATVSANRVAMRSSSPGSALLAKATGGSSGVPLHFDYTEESYERRMAMWHRGYSWAGASPGVKQFYFWGVPLGERPWWRRAKDDFYNRLYRHHIVNCFNFRDDMAAEVARELRRYRPQVIVAYANPMYSLARALDEQGIEPLSPRAIVLGAEKVHDFQRARIERTFRAPVFETYGSREFMLIAAECERHEGLHVSAENLIVEIVDDDGKPVPAGDEGNVAVTDLHNFGMPFVRYLNGDRAAASARACQCGRGLPMLEKIVGRRLDVITTPDGRRVPGELFPHLFKDFPAIRQFQVVQDAVDAVVVKMVVNGNWNDESERQARHEIEAVLGPSTRLAFALVPEIPLTRAGKLLVVVNNCVDPSLAADRT